MDKMNFKERKCPSCGQGNVKNKMEAGRTMPYKDLPDVPVPDDLKLPTCNHCNDMMIRGDLLDELDTALEKAYLKLKAKRVKQSLEAIKKKTKHISQAELERLIGLSPGYLSKLTRGIKPSSKMLDRFLFMIENDPSKSINLLLEYPQSRREII